MGEMMAKMSRRGHRRMTQEGCGMILRRMLFAIGSVLSFAAPAVAADLVIAMPNWPSGQASANILKLAIAEKFGLDAEVRELGTMLAFAGMESGEADVVPEVW